jgi:hypothetical protein
MQFRLDDRLPLSSDLELNAHAQACDECRADLNAWQSIENHVAPRQAASEESRTPRHRSAVYAIASVAASVLLLLSLLANRQPAVLQQASLTPPSVPAQDDLALTASADAASLPALREAVAPSQPGKVATAEPINFATLQTAAWWESMRQRRLIDRTMPTVRSMSDGLAPFGRSLIQAAAILTVGVPPVDDAPVRSS